MPGQGVHPLAPGCQHLHGARCDSARSRDRPQVTARSYSLQLSWKEVLPRPPPSLLPSQASRGPVPRRSQAPGIATSSLLPAWPRLQTNGLASLEKGLKQGRKERNGVCGQPYAAFGLSLSTSSHKVSVGISRKKAGESEPSKVGDGLLCQSWGGPLLSGRLSPTSFLPAGSPWLCWFSRQRWTQWSPRPHRSPWASRSNW